ncbi:uncharacterized protein Z519_05979 [Cladophialophora bantiana CBS 173.52]|uniref:Uncharacterized protein n=1 Tax=Cladophialophora bantiana (strain ATCC 10958 / CBS 173.52 / CDC B-1940 / NIH 8579) TaxID=1442370 RepID=A0A0D2I9B7_CLAB1|nr:uncharacterized protein Z519_05979 [Cladophialophora bantiana CBS 173.52]KIW93374.1 hypothetical protein Z519_05979 [Cladophialophora bantiana CBS 173.52]
MSPFHSFVLFAGVLFHITYGYVDFGSLTLPIEPIYQPTPRPNQLPGDYDLRYEVLPSMITAVAPSVTIAGNGSHQTMYSLHYHHYFSKTRQGRGIFDKRGVFASDPPIATCTPCGGGTVSYSGSSTASSTLSCTTITYHGVFDFPPSTTGAYCYDTNYSGVFQPSTSSSSGLPCCFTIPASCRINSTLSTTSTSFMASTGVFRPTTSSTTTAFSFATTTSRFSLTTASNSGGSSSQSQGPILNSGSSLTSTRRTVTVISGTTVVITTTSTSTSAVTATTSMASSSLLSSQPYTSPTSSPATSTTSLSIIVVSSTTITITNSGTVASTVRRGTSSSLSTLTVITGTASSASLTSTSVSRITTTVPNTIIGCGQASGSGIVMGTGTIYLGGTPIVTSGTASGSASNISGCGTIIATNGTFTGSAEITGCGSGSGTGTLTGTGTVWPVYGGGHISFVTSGTVSGNGNFSGCGTLTGSGTFVATSGSPVVITPSTTPTPTSRPIRTVSVYLSHCPESTMGTNDILRLASGSNVTSFSRPNFNMISSSSSSTNSTVLPASNSTVGNPLCQTCPNSVGICCPPTVHCSADDGKCPLYALENSGNTINGYLIAQVMNSSAPVAGRKKIRALEKKRDNVGKGFGGKDLVALEVEVERQLQRHQEKRAHRKQF